jgi:hypothetical protein
MNEQIMRAVGFGPEVDLVKAGKCPICHNQIRNDEFTDDCSRKEFAISGLCQTCQNDIFKESD